jgi:hypothetical protein
MTKLKAILMESAILVFDVTVIVTSDQKVLASRRQRMRRAWAKTQHGEDSGADHEKRQEHSHEFSSNQM